MLIRVKRGWEIPEADATPERVFRDRRRLIKAAAASPVLLAAPALLSACDDATDSKPLSAAASAPDPSAHLYPLERNPRYGLDRSITKEELATTYTNYYEFGSSKNIRDRAQHLPIRPWMVSIGGKVEQEMEIGVDDLLAKMPLEERLYRLRCVEAWSMAVPWSGFPLRALVELARPLSDAKYLKMVSFHNPDVAPGQRGGWYPWPYVEGLTLAEATNELAFIATGIYGKPMPKQNGAPLRLAVPWKYGFKSTKGIVRFEFTDQRPVSFWEQIQGREYGFWANVNPNVPHPRWSQATERVLGSEERVPTQLYNGYGEFVAHLYEGMEGERLFM
ncbi:MAG: protein-methionine-sulfoxide reductase catalytic subunit MsrP [Alphaproteobacteria bacterium]|nr:protein-methionine-sulfoxide reductase catalytic subunit MsrP [Alphaproteobacteria bacterium]